MSRADIHMTMTTGGAHYQGAGTNKPYQTPGGVLYQVYIDAQADVVFIKSSDNGISWSLPVSVSGAITARCLSTCYDRDSNISAGLIHCFYVDDADSDAKYRTINTESSDALSTATVIFAGASSASGCHISGSRARGGNVYCKVTIDAGAEGGFFRLPNANVPNGAWDAARADPEALATTDQAFLAPGFAADNQDMLMIYWDASANEVSRYIYDDSANTWAETSIASSMADSTAGNGFPNFDVAIDLTNSRLIMVAWSGVDAVNADLRCWTVTESAITETSANVVLNSGDDQGLAAIALDLTTAAWYVFYAGKSDGSETMATAVNVYYKVSTDSGATWGSETLLTTVVRTIWWLGVTSRWTTNWLLAFYNDHTNDNLMCSAPLPSGGGSTIRVEIIGG